jgi:hypothetical protein
MTNSSSSSHDEEDMEIELFGEINKQTTLSAAQKKEK